MTDVNEDQQVGQITFENTNTKVEVTKWYTVTGAPAMRKSSHEGDRMLVPMTARWTFMDGEPTDLFLNGRRVLKNGSTGEPEQFPDIVIWNQQTWPDWLHNLFKLACDEYRTDYLSRRV